MHTCTSNITGSAGIQKVTPWGEAMWGKKPSRYWEVYYIGKIFSLTEITARSISNGYTSAKFYQDQNTRLFSSKSEINQYFMIALSVSNLMRSSGHYPTPAPSLIYFNELQCRIIFFTKKLIFSQDTTMALCARNCLSYGVQYVAPKVYDRNYLVWIQWPVLYDEIYVRDYTDTDLPTLVQFFIFLTICLWHTNSPGNIWIVLFPKYLNWIVTLQYGRL